MKKQTKDTSSGNKWQRMTTNDNEWYGEWRLGTLNREARVTMNGNEWFNE